MQSYAQRIGVAHFPAPHMNNNFSRERAVLVHTADSMAEAMVIRGLLESAGIRSPGSASSNPFPVSESPGGGRGVEVYALESQAEGARNLIDEYLRAGETESDEDANSESEGR
ncbi:MAG: hypothetical protein WBQ34_18530 [Candidatus Acidiferrales bacterium]